MRRFWIPRSNRVRRFGDRRRHDVLGCSGTRASPQPVLPSPLWGGVGGGGRRERIPYFRQDAINVRQHVIVPEAQHTVAVSFETPCARFVFRRLPLVLAAVDLDDQLRSMTCEVRDARPDRNLPAEMRTVQRQTMAKVPPQLAFGLRGLFAHTPRESALRRHHTAIRPRPNAIVVLVARSHYDNDPHPWPLPTRGRGTRPHEWRTHSAC
jgi:hypothetical protein